MNLFHAAHVPAGSGPFPTVLALHGWGASAHDLLGLAPMFHAGQALVVCPQGPIAVPTGPQSQGYGWFPLSSGGPPDAAGFKAGQQVLREFIDEALERYPADPERTIALGFSQGGVMAYDLALQQPERFAALVALSSWLPEEIAARARRSPELEALPTLVIHGTQDSMIPCQRAVESRERLEALGIRVAHGEYEMGHEISNESLADLLGWLGQTVFDR